MNFLLSMDDAARPERGVVRFDGATSRTDSSSLATLSASLTRMGIVHVDLSGIDCVPFALVVWLLRQQLSVDRRGGRLTVGRAPAALALILSTIGRPGALHLTDARL